MDAATNVANWIAKSNASPALLEGMTLDLDRRAWTMQLEYLSGPIASASLDELLGEPDLNIPFIVRRWTFDLRRHHRHPARPAGDRRRTVLRQCKSGLI